jgi:hypothetical protein
MAHSFADKQVTGWNACTILAIPTFGILTQRYLLVTTSSPSMPYIPTVGMGGMVGRSGDCACAPRDLYRGRTKAAVARTRLRRTSIAARRAGWVGIR